MPGRIVTVDESFYDVRWERLSNGLSSYRGGHPVTKKSGGEIRGTREHINRNAHDNLTTGG